MAKTRFPLGQLLATPGALAALEDSGQTADFFLAKHALGDWGDVGVEDKGLNWEAVTDGGRLLSSYKTLKGVKLLVITEAADDDGMRATTTILLPEEY